jgi:hypothetical protein
MRGRTFELGNTFGSGRPRGSPNKKGLILQQLLLENSEEIIGTLMDRAKKGDRAALALCVERLIPRLKDTAELPEDSLFTTNEDTEDVDLSILTDEELAELRRLTAKVQVIKAESDDGHAPAPKAA